MQCPNCKALLPDGSLHCGFCGTALANQPSSQPIYGQQPSYGAPMGQPPYGAMPSVLDQKPEAVRNACRRCVKSPLMLVAIIAYTIYTVILTAQLFPMMDYFGIMLEGLEEAPLVALSFIVIMFLYIPSIFLSVGLWKMFASNGFEGSGLTRGSITAIRVMKITAVGALLLTVVIMAGEMEISLSDMGVEELLLPLAVFVFSMVALGAMRNVAESVSYTAIYEKANIDGVMSAGVMMLILAAVELFALTKVMDVLSQMNTMSMIASYADDLDAIQFANVMYVVALTLFGIGAVVFHTNISRAYEEDENLRYRQRMEKESAKTITGPKMTKPVNQPVAQPQVKEGSEEETITLLKKYKELLDGGIITQEEYDQKKNQLLNKDSSKV